MAGADFWNDKAAAQKVLQRRKRVESDLELVKRLGTRPHRMAGQWRGRR